MDVPEAGDRQWRLGALPVLQEVRQEATRRDVELVVTPTLQAIELLRSGDPETNAILHVTC